jgi:hypothetical protein
MPRLNLDVLISQLNRHQQRLYNIYILTTNLEIADLILQERDNICLMIQELQGLL